MAELREEKRQTKGALANASTGRAAGEVTVAERLLSPDVLLIVYIVLALAATLSKILIRDFVAANGMHYPQPVNYALFQNAFFHLIHGQDIYAKFPAEQWDVFKYSPAFALLMAPIAILPAKLGVFVWNALNALAIYVAVRAVPEESERSRGWVLWFVALSLMVNMQSAQSNGLMAGLMIGAWAAQERGKPLLSSLCIMLSVFTKLFGGIGILPCLLVSRGRGKLVGYTAMWSALLAVLPLVVVRPTQLLQLYRSWYISLAGDNARALGRSVMGLLRAWLHHTVPEHYVLPAAGLILVLVLALRYDAHREPRFRMLAAASTLVWVVIFNHMAESPTMVIAVAGAALWYFFQEPDTVNGLLLALTFLLTCLTPTDIVPRFLREAILRHYLEVLPLLLVWIKIQADLIRFPKTPRLEAGS